MVVIFGVCIQANAMLVTGAQYEMANGRAINLSRRAVVG